MRPHATLAVTALLFVLQVTSTPASMTSSLVVRTFDLSGVPGEQMLAAREAAGSILRDGGLVLEWRDCSVACADAPGAHDVLLRIAAAPASTPPGPLGYSLVDTSAKSGMLATLYLDRIVSTARRTGVAPGLLLGRAIAHEIAHLRLGTTAHTADGLMRARWSDRELRRNRAADWALSRRSWRNSHGAASRSSARGWQL